MYRPHGGAPSKSVCLRVCSSPLSLALLATIGVLSIVAMRLSASKVACSLSLDAAHAALDAQGLQLASMQEAVRVGANEADKLSSEVASLRIQLAESKEQRKDSPSTSHVKPVTPPLSLSIEPASKDPRQATALLIICYNRPAYLKRTLATVLTNLPSYKRPHIYISQVRGLLIARILVRRFAFWH